MREAVERGPELHDTNSGFNQPHAGYLYLTPAQALAFVRERDNLPNGDLDRTHRQQAVIDYVIRKLEHEGGQRLRPAHKLARRGEETHVHRLWLAVLTFASEMHALTGKNLTFQTAPVITTDGQMDGQTANLVNPAAIKLAVQNTFTRRRPCGSRRQAHRRRRRRRCRPARSPWMSTTAAARPGWRASCPRR